MRDRGNGDYQGNTTKGDEEASLLRADIPKSLKKGTIESVEKFIRREELEVTAALWSHFSLFTVFKGMSTDILNVDAQFPLDQLLFMRDLLPF